MDLKINSYLILILLFFQSQFNSRVFACNLKSAGGNAARSVSQAAVASSKELSQGLNDATAKLTRSLDAGVESVQKTVKDLSGTVKALADNVKVRVDSGDLENMGAAATQNLKDALALLSENWRLAVDTADLKDFGAEAARHLSEALQSINVKIEVLIGIDDNLLEAVRSTTDQLTSSFSQGVNVTATTVRHLADSVTGLAKNINARIDSGDLAYLGDAATNNLKLALIELSRNWELAVNTADLKDVGSEAARHLSQAIQNINIYIKIGFDDNVVQAVKYVSIAGGFAFAVLFVAILISLRKCRSCTASLFTLCIIGCSNCRQNNPKNDDQNDSDSDDENDDLKKSNKKNRNRKLNSKEKEPIEMITFVRNDTKSQQKKNNLNLDSDENIYEVLNEVEPLQRVKSLQGYNDYEPTKRFWERLENQRK